MLKKEILVISLLLGIFLCSGLYYAVTNSITSDEKTHISTGYIIVRFNDYRFNIEHPPFIKQLAGIPLLFMKLAFPLEVYKSSSAGSDIVNIQQLFLFKLGNNLDLMVFLARLPCILISLLLGVFIYLFSKRLNGVYAGLVSLVCYICCPNFLGHSPLANFDVAVSCFYFMAVYFLIRYFESASEKFIFLTAVFLGITIISKYSGLILIPAVYILTVLGVFLCGDKDKKFNGKLNNWHFILGIPAFVLVIAYKLSFWIVFPAFLIYLIKNRMRLAGKILLIVLTIGFMAAILDYTNFKLFPFRSPTMAYFKGFAFFTGHAAGGHNAYLMGKYSNTGWRYYFPLAMLFKTPPVTICLIILGFVGLCKKSGNNLQKLFLLIPFLLYLFAACFINKVNIGIRHILVVYPFLFVIAGYSVIFLKSRLKQKLLKPVIFLSAFLLVLDVGSAYPAHLSYFNIMCGGIKNGYKLLGDSNIAWGQDYKRLKAYIDNNNIKEVKIESCFGGPFLYGYYGIPYADFLKQDYSNPREGFYVVESTMLQSHNIKWVNDIAPAARIGGSLLAYKITKADAERIKKCFYQ